MRSKNSKALTPRESRHVALVKSIACACCDQAGGYAHHIVQGQHWTTVGLCYECHQGPLGWHGDKTLWRIRKLDELKALNITLARVDALKAGNLTEYLEDAA